LRFHIGATLDLKAVPALRFGPDGTTESEMRFEQALRKMTVHDKYSPELSKAISTATRSKREAGPLRFIVKQTKQESSR
jgi:hypothetical protein